MGNGVPYETNGGMMTILEFASIFYLIQMIVTVLFICTDWFKYHTGSASLPCEIGYRFAKIFIALVCIVHLGLIFVTALNRYDTYTLRCVDNQETLIESSDTTFADHGEEVQNLFITQCTLGVLC